MSKVAVGSIPEKICYTYSDEAEVAVGCAWDISWYDNDDGPKTVKTKVLPAFPADDADEKTKTRAKQWAEQNYYNQKKKTAKTEVRDNKPLQNIKVLSLEERGNGGRAYKALIDNYYVDLREDVLMDTILKVGIKEGGVLQGEYVWAKMGSQMRLVRVGSELHRLVTEFESKKDIKPVGKGDLEVGGVYQDRKKNKAVFVGYINTALLKATDGKVDYYYKRDTKPSFDFKVTKVKKSMLFYELPAYEKQAVSIKQMKSDDKSYYYKIKKSHTYIEKVDQITLPDGIVEHLRTKAVTEAKNYVLEYTGHKEPKKNVQRIDAWYLQEHVEYNADHINMYPTDGTPVEPFDLKKLILFS